MKRYFLFIISSIMLVFTTQATAQRKPDTHNYKPNQLQQSFFEKIDYSSGKIQQFIKQNFSFQNPNGVEESDVKTKTIFTKRFLELMQVYDPYESSDAEIEQYKEKWKGVYNKLIAKSNLSLSPICGGRFIIGETIPIIRSYKKYNYYCIVSIELRYVGYNSFDTKREDPFVGSCYSVIYLVQIDNQLYADALEYYFEDYPNL